MRTRALALAGALWLVPLAARAAAAPLPAGSYVLEGGAGTLVVGRPKAGGQSFRIEVVGSNAHTCGLEGRVRNGAATLEGEPAGPPCVVRFATAADGIGVTAPTPDPCRVWCGARAWFEGTYLRPAPECKPARVKAARNRFRVLYHRNAYADARAILAPLLERCARVLDRFEVGWIRNDLALTLHHLGEDAACNATLAPLADLAAAGDDDIRDSEPAFAEENLRLARATRHNVGLCAARR